MTSSRQQRRQLERRRAREEARRAAERAAKRRRRARIFLPLGLVLVVGAIVFFMTQDDDGETVATEDDSAADAKPCVKLADPLPPGAPEVPIKEGPPPEELIKEDLKVGDGTEVKPGDKATVHYVGVSCSTGKIFDSSWSRNEPFPASLSGGVIKGWQEGVPGMKVGGRRLLGIPADMAYGASPPPGSDIAPNEALWFVVDVVATGPDDGAPPGQ